MGKKKSGKSKVKTVQAQQTLTSKVLKHTFKAVMKAYDSKSYKKALKLADTILKTHPCNGETLAMRGLVTHCMKVKKNQTEADKNAEAEAQIKDGLKYNSKSKVCWQVYGLFLKNVKKYAMAIKAYKNALRIKPSETQMWRELSSMQMQIRDYKGYLHSRSQVLQNNADNSRSWRTFIVAQYVNKDYDAALKVLTSYRGTLSEEKKDSFDYSELCYLEHEIIIAKGDLQAALKHLDTHKQHMRDQVRFRERKVWLYMKSQMYEEAREVYISLFKLNPENYNYHRGYQCALLQSTDHWHINGGTDLPIEHINLTEEQRSMLHAEYIFLQRHQPRSTAHKHILLVLAPASEFRSQIGDFMRSAIQKAKPCHFEILKTIVRGRRDPAADFEIVSEVLAEALAFQDNGRTLFGKELSSQECLDETPPPTDVLFTLLYLAQVRDYQGHHTEALALLDRGKLAAECIFREIRQMTVVQILLLRIFDLKRLFATISQSSFTVYSRK